MAARRRITRRRALGRIAAGMAAGAGLAGLGRRAWAAQERRPNIVFILTDDQRWDAMGCMGHPFLKTPNLDRLRSEGVLFANAFVTTSLCSPSRASFLTGAHAHVHGVINNRGTEFKPARTPHFPLVLQQAGYETAFVGKWHQNSRSDPRPGFDDWLSFSGQGVYTDPRFNDNGRAVRAKGYMSDLLTDRAVAFIQRDRAKPFCLVLSHKAVHAPFTPAPRHQNLYADVDLPEPASWNDPFTSKPIWQRRGGGGSARTLSDRIRSSQLGENAPAPKRPWNPRNRQWLDYFRTINGVDDSVGRVMTALREKGLLDSTVVIFAGDNGYFLGEHGRGDKRLMYEESIRIPLILRAPHLGQAGATAAGMALNIDIAPTILDLAGAKVPDTVQGRSLRPLLEGKADGWRTSFLYQYWKESGYEVPSMLGVRTTDWKLVTYPETNDIDELYDLANDPHELINLAADPKHAAKHEVLQRELDRLCAEARRQPRPSPATRPAAGGLVLDYAFDRTADGQVTDASGKGNHGTIVNAKIVQVGDRPVLACDGEGYVEVPKSASLDPSRRDWTVEAWVTPRADGVVLAHGGTNLGYVLFVDAGVPAFGVRTGQTIFIAEGRESSIGKRVHLAGVLGGGTASIYVNGAYVDSLPVSGTIGKDPTEGLQIGRDLNTGVDEKMSGVGFKGTIGAVRIHSRALTADEIKAAFQRGGR